MKIGIVVYSLSGHTLAAAESLQERLAADGHRVTLERLEMVGPARSSAEKGAELKTRPAVEPYDALVFACPVRGGLPPPPMASYLQQIPSLQDKKVACLVTHFFPRAWGGNQTLAAMTEVCTAKGATLCGAGSVRWFGPGRTGRMAQAVDAVVRCLG
jgi:multimeric flavodoxin WrbA